MQRRTLLLAGAAASATSASAMFAALSDEELLRTADLIALAVWLGQSHLQPGPQQPPLELGVLQIKELWRGPAGLPLAFVQAELPGRLRASDSLSFQPGDSGLWLLPQVSGSQGLYRCNHPQRFVPSNGGQAQIAALRERFRAAEGTRKPR